LGIKPVLIPPGPDFRADVAAMAQAITPQTLFLVGSAPAYPHGVVDPILDLAALAKSHSLPLHVDACVGGFSLPFVRKAGYPVPPFDFSVPWRNFDVGGSSQVRICRQRCFDGAVSNARAAPPPILCLLWLARRAVWLSDRCWALDPVEPSQPPGPVSTRSEKPAFCASRASIMKTTRILLDGIAAIPGLVILGQTRLRRLCLWLGGARSDGHRRPDGRTWLAHRSPAVSDLDSPDDHPGSCPIANGIWPIWADSVAHVTAHPELSSEGTAAMYGMLMHIPDPSMVEDFILSNFDSLYR
jgi:sphinganine-1-phosphate aldolase